MGQRISERQLVANALSVGVQASEGVRWAILFEPTWQLRQNDEVLAGSRQAQDEKDGSGWPQVAAVVDRLVGVEILGIDQVPGGELVLRLSDGLEVRSFVSDPRDEDLWQIRNRTTLRGIQGGPRGLTLTASGPGEG